MPSRISLIKSRRNPKYKEWLGYVSQPHLPGCRWLSVEGPRQIRELSAKQPIELLLFSDGKASRLTQLIARSRQTAHLSENLLETLSSLETSQGVMAFFRKPSWGWEDLASCVLYLDRLQDPGNLGTLLRTARATGIFSVVTSPKTVSCFNSKVVRASAVTLFSTPFLEGVPVGELKRRGYRLWAATPREGQALFKVRFQSPLAIVLGNEGSGLDKSVLRQGFRRLHIPMHPEAESLNVAVAGSLILYEVTRQTRLYG